MQCEVWSAKREVRRIKECEVWSVERGVGKATCKLWSVKCGVRSVVSSVKCQV